MTAFRLVGDLGNEAKFWRFATTVSVCSRFLPPEFLNGSLVMTSQSISLGAAFHVHSSKKYRNPQLMGA